MFYILYIPGIILAKWDLWTAGNIFWENTFFLCKNRKFIKQDYILKTQQIVRTLQFCLVWSNMALYHFLLFNSYCFLLIFTKSISYLKEFIYSQYDGKCNCILIGSISIHLCSCYKSILVIIIHIFISSMCLYETEASFFSNPVPVKVRLLRGWKD